MKYYRFYKIFGGALVKYFSQQMDGYTDRAHAGLFTEQDWHEWGNEAGMKMEAIGEDEAMRAIGAPRLPGLEQ